MGEKDYNMAFTAGVLFLQESISIAELYKGLKDWGAVREKVLVANLLQTRTEATAKRLCREIIPRLKNLHSYELGLLVETNPQEQGYLLWVAICRRYRFIAEFAVEVVRERYITLKCELGYEDFDIFFDWKAQWHDELEAIRSSTRKKLRQVLFRMLREADLLSPSSAINPALLSHHLVRDLARGDKRELQFFPVFDADIQRILN